MPLTGSYADIEHVLHARDGAPVPVRHLVPSGTGGRRRPDACIQVAAAALVRGGHGRVLLARPGRRRTRRCGCGTRSLEGKLPTIEQLTYDPRIFPYRFGQALLAYIGERWGDEAIGAILQGTLGGGIEAAFRRVLGLDARAALGCSGGTPCRRSTCPEIGSRVQGARRSPGRSSPRSARTGHAAPGPGALARRQPGRVLQREATSTSSISGWPTARPARSIRRLLKSTWSSNYETFRFINSPASWSPDGKYLAFAAKRGPRDDIVIVDVDAQPRGRSGSRSQLNGVTTPSLEPRRQAARLHRLRRRALRPLHRQRGRDRTSAADQRQVRRPAPGLVARRQDHRVRHRPRARHRLHGR